MRAWNILSAVPLVVVLFGVPRAHAQSAAPAGMMSTVQRFLQDDGWNPQAVEGLDAWKMPFRGNTQQWTCVALVVEADQQLVFYSIMDDNVPADRRAEVADFLARVNFQLAIGNFELDMDSGELRYKTAIDVTGSSLSTTMLTNLAYTNVKTMDGYIEGARDVAFRGSSPSAAWQSISGG